MSKNQIDLNSSEPIFGGVALSLAVALGFEPFFGRLFWIIAIIFSGGQAAMFYLLGWILLIVINDEDKGNDDESKKDSSNF